MIQQAQYFNTFNKLVKVEELEIVLYLCMESRYISYFSGRGGGGG